MAKRRQKTRGRDDGGSEAAGMNPRLDPDPKGRCAARVRPECHSNEGSAPPQDGRLEAQGLKEPTPAQNSSPEGPRSALPGEFDQRAGRWWWRVKLPGEEKAKARPLKPEGAKAAVGDWETAERIAFEMWEHAVQENAVRQIRLESTEKIERLKAQFLDKVRHFTELVETANAKIEAETKARTEAEAKLAQMAQGRQPSTPRTEAEESPVLQDDLQLGEMESTAPAAANPPLEVGACECCGVTGVALAYLKRIDSGQSLCPRCLAALRADATRIESAPAE